MFQSFSAKALVFEQPHAPVPGTLGGPNDRQGLDDDPGEHDDAEDAVGVVQDRGPSQIYR